MPVPVSVTHAQRAGLQSSTHTELPTAGPFATLGSRSSGNERKVEDERIEEAIRPGNEAHCAVAEGNVPAIRTNHLSFWYCDIGASVVSISVDIFYLCIIGIVIGSKDTKMRPSLVHWV